MYEGDGRERRIGRLIVSRRKSGRGRYGGKVLRYSVVIGRVLHSSPFQVSHT